ncbi:hypothetical protein Hanom_Chr10g00963431 [Helianthus anomalus]
MNYRTQTNTLPSVHKHKRTNAASVHVRLFNKRTNTNKLPAEQFMNCSLNVWFVCSPICKYSYIKPNMLITNLHYYS